MLRLVILFFLLSSSWWASADWKIDLSRRVSPAPAESYTTPTPLQLPEKKEFMGMVFSAGEPMQEVVILQTAEGFVPSTLRFRVGISYKVTVVNINEAARNVSFVMDAFSEYHATFYGQTKTFMLKPVQEGTFTFISPETAAKGRLIVHPDLDSTVPGSPPSSPALRAPASEL